MATFTRGQRVKYVSGIHSPQVPIGALGTVLEPDMFEGYRVAFDGRPSEAPGGSWGVFSTSIVPAVDPRESQWADEKIREVCKPKSLSLHPSELETVRGGA